MDAPEAPRVVLADEILVAQGWAGELTLGMRVRDIVFAMCGKIVGRGQVALQRGDVAAAVHRNLSNSGWEAQIYAGDLPRCADARLSAWSVFPGNAWALVRLIGEFPLEVVGEPVADYERVSSMVPISPDFAPPKSQQSVEILASRANIRRCGSTDCAIVGQIDRGTYPAFVVERRDTWSIVVFPEVAGWLFNELYRVAP